MAINVLEVERDQLFLMPPSVADWLRWSEATFQLQAVLTLVDPRRARDGRSARGFITSGSSSHEQRHGRLKRVEGLATDKDVATATL